MSKRLKIYIAGKITGDPYFKEKFARVKLYFENLGYIVLNPAELPGGMINADYMRICLAMIDSADVVYFLSDYVESGGAQVEYAYSRYVEKEIVFDTEIIEPSHI